MTAIIVIIIIWTQFCFHEKFQNVLAIEKMLGLLELKRRIGEWLQFCKLIVQTSGHRCWWLSRRWLCGSRKRGEDRVQFTRVFSELIDERMESRCPLRSHGIYTQQRQNKTSPISTCRGATQQQHYIFSPTTTCTWSTHNNDRTKHHPYLHVEDLHIWTTQYNFIYT